MLILKSKDIAKTADKKLLKDLTREDMITDARRRITTADIVAICEDDKCKIIKDRYSIARGLRLDADGLCTEVDLRLIETNHPQNQCV